MEFGSLVTDDFCEFVEMGRFGRPDKGGGDLDGLADELPRVGSEL